MLIGRHSFIRQSKLSDVAGRIDYISNPKRQEYLYATYQTEGATTEFWKNLARENQLDFKASGSAGKCIEGREFIIALPESFVQYRADDMPSGSSPLRGSSKMRNCGFPTSAIAKARR